MVKYLWPQVHYKSRIIVIHHPLNYQLSCNGYNTKANLMWLFTLFRFSDETSHESWIKRMMINISQKHLINTFNVNSSRRICASTIRSLASKYIRISRDLFSWLPVILFCTQRQWREEKTTSPDAVRSSAAKNRCQWCNWSQYLDSWTTRFAPMPNREKKKQKRANVSDESHSEIKKEKFPLF